MILGLQSQSLASILWKGKLAKWLVLWKSEMQPGCYVSDCRPSLTMRTLTLRRVDRCLTVVLVVAYPHAILTPARAVELTSCNKEAMHHGHGGNGIPMFTDEGPEAARSKKLIDFATGKPFDYNKALARLTKVFSGIFDLSQEGDFPCSVASCGQMKLKLRLHTALGV